MRYALRLAARGLGRTAPNPTVGAVLVQEGRIVGMGHTAPGGRPHAEPQAITMAGKQARGATLYVTLEPCNHTGQTPPCTDAIIKAGITRVVIACTDPNPKVSGGGIAALQQAGIEVHTGLCEAEAQILNAGFFKVQKQGLPFVTLKLGLSKDGKIAAAPGTRTAISGPQALRIGHMLRARHDAILVGAGTVLADDPQLTCRLPGLEGASPLRVVMDTHLRTPHSAALLQAQESAPTWLLTKQADASFPCPNFAIATRPDSRLDPQAALRFLAQRGITHVLLEGGAKLAESFLQADLVDEVVTITAPMNLGPAGVKGLTDAQEKLFQNGTVWHTAPPFPAGDDILQHYTKI